MISFYILFISLGSNAFIMHNLPMDKRDNVFRTSKAVNGKMAQKRI